MSRRLIAFGGLWPAKADTVVVKRPWFEGLGAYLLKEVQQSGPHFAPLGMPVWPVWHGDD
jgi:hypothetical protein